MDNTPYDDVFRTLLTDCTELMIPVVNEIFHTDYTGKETICLLQNEHFYKNLPQIRTVNRNALPIPALKLSVKKPHRSFKYSESAIILNVRVQKTAV